MNNYLKTAGFTLAGLYGAAYALKSARVKLDFFEPSEFGLWWPIVDDALLYGVDDFRRALGLPVEISPAPGALGRWGPDARESQHYAASGVKAVDVLIPESVTLAHAYDVARSIDAFSGIGLYPHWVPRHGMHLDVRVDRTAASPALWSGIKVGGVQVYKNIEEAFA